MNPEKPKSAIAAMLQMVKEASNPGMNSDVSFLERTDVLTNTGADPLALLSQAVFGQKAEIVRINPSECTLWQFKDRPASDLGDLEQLAVDIKINGQLQPGIVRLSTDSGVSTKKYELLVGERRWRACAKANIKFEAIVKNFPDQVAAIVQASENLQRKDLSDYAKGMSYSKLIQAGILSQTELQKKLALSKATLSAFLSFGSISRHLLTAIEDWSHVSAHVASIIRAFSNKGDAYIQRLIALAPQIRKGVGGETLKKLLENASPIKQPGIRPLTSTMITKMETGESAFTLKIQEERVSEIKFLIRPKNIQAIQDFILARLHEEFEGLAHDQQ